MKNTIRRPHLRAIREKNRINILKLLRTKKSISKPQIAELLNLSPMSVSRLVRDLVNEGVCISSGPINNDKSIGRRPNIIRINPNYGMVVAICLSAFSKAVSITDVNGLTLLKTNIPESACGTPQQAMNFIETTISEFLENSASSSRKLLGCAVVIAGQYNVHSGILLTAPLLNWPKFELKANIETFLGCPVIVDNIANALCINFVDLIQQKVTKNPNIMLVHVAAGMGASFFINGGLVDRGGDEGWIGQIKIQGLTGSNKEKSSLNDCVSGRAILNRLSEETNFSITSPFDFASNFKKAVKHANITNSGYQKIFYEAGYTLGENLFYLSFGFKTDAVVLGGPIRHSIPFKKGLRLGFKNASQDVVEPFTSIEVNQSSYLDAAEIIALREHFYS